MSFTMDTARAIVVDDEVRDVQPIFQVLSEMGIGYQYFDGSLEIADKVRLSGVRLAFMDMDLGLAGAESEEEIADQAARYLASLLDPDEFGVIAIFCFTSKPEVYNLFNTIINDQLENQNIICVEKIAKTATVSQIHGILNKALEDKLGIKLLWLWEKTLHESLIHTSSTLMSVVRHDPGSPAVGPNTSDSLLRLFSALAVAARERPPADGLSATYDFLNALYSVQEDHIEMRRHGVLSKHADVTDAFKVEIDKLQILVAKRNDDVRVNERIKAIKSAVGAELKIKDIECIINENSGNVIKKTETKKKAILSFLSAHERKESYPLNAEHLARINRMIHVSYDASTNDDIMPGTVYDIGKKFGRATLCKSLFGMDIEDFVERTVRKTQDVAKGFLLEVSPACDHAQAKIHVPRFVAGILLPEESKEKIPNLAEFIWEKSGPVFLDAIEGFVPAGMYRIVLNAHFQAGIPPAKTAELKQLFRIRKNTLTDIQAWLARHGSRPGIVSVR